MNDKNKQLLYYGRLNHSNWELYIAATDRGLCFVGSPNKGLDEMQAWAFRSRPKAKLIDDEEKVIRYTQQIKEYLDGERKEFDVPVDLQGTPFQELVWKELRKIPYGEVVSYSDIAARIASPKAVRAVGSANGANPVMIVVPCHRVISKNGSLAGFRGGIEMKKALVAIEKSNMVGVK